MKMSDNRKIRNDVDVSVIVASGRAEIDDCLKSLMGQKGDFRKEIIVVYDSDNLSSKPQEGVRYIKCETTNPAVKRNIGACASTGNVLAFIDDDAIAPSDWIRRGMDVLEKFPNAAGCGGPNLPPPEQSARERLSDAVLRSKLGAGTGSYLAGGEVHEARIGEIHLVNFFVKRAVFEAAAGFNEALGYGAEDSEFIYLCKRMANAVFIYDPALCVEHRRRPFGAEFFSQRFRLRKQNGRILWVRPGMYVTRKSGLFLASLPALAWVACLQPAVLVALIAIYIALLLKEARSVKNVGKLEWILAVMMLHAVSALGIFAGWVVPPSKEKYLRLLRRPV